MKDLLEDIPDRLFPYVIMTHLDAYIELDKGTFPVVAQGKVIGQLDGSLSFRWVPSTAVEFEGMYSGQPVDIHSELALAVDTALIGPVEMPVRITRETWGPTQHLRGIVRHAVTRHGSKGINRLRFCLVNFPRYIGHAIAYSTDRGKGFYLGRLEVTSENLVCIVDEIQEVRDLRRAARQDAGFIISHVGELRVVDGEVDRERADELIRMLRWFLGFIRGAWSGPVFPQGFLQDEQTWAELAAWKVDETHSVPSWLPQKSPVQLDQLWVELQNRWCSAGWQETLETALSWLIEANSSRAAHETKIVLGQVALDLLAWFCLVEMRQLHSRSDFGRLSSAGRVRSLLHHLNIPADLPTYLPELSDLSEGDAFDGPGVLARIRNALVHSKENSRALVSSLSGLQLWQGGQLALQYVELVLLALLDYQGKYARRSWRLGWKGDDEVPVPWSQSP